jgi:hypothetical protein
LLILCVSKWLREREADERVMGLGSAAGGSTVCAIVGLVGGGRSRAGAVGVFLLFFFLLVPDSCVRSLVLFWTREMMSDAGTLWAGG